MPSVCKPVKLGLLFNGLSINGSLAYVQRAGVIMKRKWNSTWLTHWAIRFDHYV